MHKKMKKKIIFSYILFFNHEVISCERQFFWYIFLKPIFALINQNSNSFHEGFIQINIFYHLLHARPSILDDEDLWGVCVAKKSMRDFAIHIRAIFSEADSFHFILYVEREAQAIWTTLLSSHCLIDEQAWVSLNPILFLQFHFCN